MPPAIAKSRPDAPHFPVTSRERLSPESCTRVARKTAVLPGAIMKLSRIAAFAIAVLAASPSFADELKWSDWGDDLFTRAAAEKRFVILDLEAVWCHWCHVMEKTTYADSEVKSLLASD